tara:strand:- start:2375 stop:3730 length:1356 start_codon:yes stop_codon:yes gene_type:complete
MLENIYLKSPKIIRDIFVNARGYQLKLWRYNKKTEIFIDEAEKFESMTNDEVKSFQEEMLYENLLSASQTIPFYISYWEERGASKNTISSLDNWPIINKEQLRKTPDSFISINKYKPFMFKDSTSGTTGTPLQMYIDRDSLVKYIAIYEYRLRRKYGVSINDKWGIVGGQVVVPFDQKSPPFWVYNKSLNQIYFSNNHISEENAIHYLEAFNNYKLNHIVTYPSSINLLATYALATKYHFDNLKLIITNAEFLSKKQKEKIQNAFGAQVVSTYGMCEMVCSASDRDENDLCLWPEVGYVQILDDNSDKKLKDGEVGRIVATGFINKGMQLIRYDTGDRGSIDNYKKTNFQSLTSIKGRSSDIILTPGGRKVWWVNPIFYQRNIEEGQVIQKSINKIIIKIVPSEGYSHNEGNIIKEKLIRRTGIEDIVIDVVKEIPREKSGKFKPVISFKA